MVDLNIELPEGFLEEEIRYGYTVTRKMKEVWAIELDMLDKLLTVCKKHNIKIFASGGTMLGAVRHKGFIPWDDDIDMMMFREDYEKLCQIAEFEFQYPYFFQTEYTDEGSLRGHAQLRNSKTTGILTGEIDEKYKFNQGIFLDIFPLDNVPDDKCKRNKQAKKIKFYKKRSFFWAKFTTRYNENNKSILKKTIKKIVAKIGGNLIRKLQLEKRNYCLFERECKKFNNKETVFVSTLSLNESEKQFYKYKKDYINLIEMPFEFMSIPVGENYDHALCQRYGKYMEIVKNGSCHGDVIFDTNNPYVAHLK